MYVSKKENPSHKAQLKSRCGASSTRNNSNVQHLFDVLSEWKIYPGRRERAYTWKARGCGILFSENEENSFHTRSRAAKEAIKQNVKLKMNYWAQIKNKSLCPGELLLILLRGAFIIFYAWYLHVTTTHTFSSLTRPAGRPAALENLLILYTFWNKIKWNGFWVTELV